MTGVAQPNLLETNSLNAVRAAFAVSEVWKGPTAATIAVATAQSSASCGYEFAVGTEYIVYARLDDTRFTTSLCSRTAPLAQAADDVRALGAGTRPRFTPPTPTVAQSWLLYVGATLGALVAVGGMWLALRRRVHMR